MEVIDWLDRHLVPNWRSGWRWWGNHAAIAFGAIGATVAASPDLLIQLAAMMGGTPRLQALVIALTIGVLLLRMWNQESDDDAEA